MKKNNINVIVCISCFLTISLIFGSTLTYGSRSDVEAFVTRFYQQCLGRAPDQQGLDGWVNALLNGSLTGADVANGFIFSDEFINQYTTNEDFVTILYRAFFNREPDDAGYLGWLNYLYDGNSRSEALNGFVSSQEFYNLCNNYGITPDSSTDSGGDSSSGGIGTNPVTSCNEVVIGQGSNQTDNTFHSLVVHPSNPNFVMIGNEGNGIFKSVDGGVNWHRKNSGLEMTYHQGYCEYPEIYEIIFDWNNPSRIFLATTGYFYYSLNSGETWNKVSNGFHTPFINAIVQDPQNPDIFYVGTGNDSYSLTGPNAYKSTDGGITWSGLNLPVNDNKITSMVIDPTNPSVIYCSGYVPDNMDSLSPSHLGLAKSQDGGATWTTINTGLPFLKASSISIDKNNPNTLYATVWNSEGTTLKSTDAGQTWSTLPLGTPFNLKVSPHTSDTMIGTFPGISITTDGGTTWSQAVPLESGVTHSDTEFTNDASVVYASTDYLRVYKSVNGGQNFTLIASLRD